MELSKNYRRTSTKPTHLLTQSFPGAFIEHLRKFSKNSLVASMQPNKAYEMHLKSSNQGFNKSNETYSDILKPQWSFCGAFETLFVV